MDLFDLFPLVPPQLPGERSARGPMETLAAGVAVGLLDPARMHNRLLHRERRRDAARGARQLLLDVLSA
jgi:hypothetical protein